MSKRITCPKCKKGVWEDEHECHKFMVDCEELDQEREIWALDAEEAAEMFLERHDEGADEPTLYEVDVTVTAEDGTVTLFTVGGEAVIQYNVWSRS